MTTDNQPTSVTTLNTDRQTKNPKKTWGDAFSAYMDRRVLTLILLGFSAGLPFPLIFSTLSIWLDEAGFDIKLITMFSWAGLAYSFKFIWSPLVDIVPLPILTKKLGQRRAWLLVAQVLILLMTVMLGSFSPTSEQVLVYMAVFAVLLGFSSATQDIVIDAYRIEIADVSLQTALSASYVAGYRIAYILSAGGALFLASWFGSVEGHYSHEAWQKTYYVMASFVGVGILTTLFVAKPTVTVKHHERKTQDYLNLFLLFLVGVGTFIGSFILIGNVMVAMLGDLTAIKSPLLKFLIETLKFVVSAVSAILVGTVLVKANVINKQVAMEVWVEPIKDFFVRYGKKAILLLLLIGLYRISDIIAGATSNIFYTKELGFTKEDVATAVKTVGMIMTILGGFVGGLLAERFRVMPAMMIGAILASASNLLFVLLAMKGHDFTFFYLAVVLDNLASGLASAVFLAFLSSLTNIRFTAVQYAVLSSLMTLTPKILSGYSGSMVAEMGYANFYTFTALIGLPILYLVYLVDKKIMLNQTINIEDNQNAN